MKRALLLPQVGRRRYLRTVYAIMCDYLKADTVEKTNKQMYLNNGMAINKLYCRCTFNIVVLYVFNEKIKIKKILKNSKARRLVLVFVV